MRNILTFVIAVITMACSKNKEDHSALYGEWAFQSETKNGAIGENPCKEYSYIIITENTYETHDFRTKSTGCKEDVAKVNYTVSGNQITIEVGGQKASASYSIKGDILTLTLPSGVVTTYKKNARKTPPANPFIGTWKLEAISDAGESVTPDACMKQSTYVFSEKSVKVTLVEKKGNSSECISQVSEATYTTSDNKIVITEKGKSVEYTFSIEGNVLTLSGIAENKEPYAFTFKKQ
ncbi:lipocalin family protein [Capnocytophaga sp.]|uniref:lipocalin family protein n=1 Tax=Capnocytophaga sp. TaxID=44737 RepID=UPI0026DB9E1D|nr:lipocalin family protein [Capnocytophaga sp.]MDO5106417.1 lipocalin family protein [Capnocytophaga sp.]